MAKELKGLLDKPKLVPIEVDGESTMAAYGEIVTVYVKSRLSIKEFFELGKAASTGDDETLFAFVQPMVVDKDGKPLFSNGDEADPKVIVEVVTKVAEYLMGVVGKQ